MADLQRAQPTIFLSVPRLWLKIQQGVFAKMPRERLDKLLRIPILNRSVKRRILRRLGLSSVAHAASGAAPLPPEIITWYRKLGLNLLEGYGMTETLITHLPSPDSMRPGYVGAAIAGVEAKLGENSELLPRSRGNARHLHRGRLHPHRRRSPDRTRRATQDCRPRERAVQNQQGKICGAGAHRESIHG
jgi:long-chain acyl-CoA synthetase